MIIAPADFRVAPKIGEVGAIQACRSSVATFCRETHAFVPMRINYPIKPGQIGVRRRHSPSHLETIFPPRPQARLERWYGRWRSKAGGRSAARGRLKRYC